MLFFKKNEHTKSVFTRAHFCKSMISKVFQTIGIDPGMRNMGIAYSTYELIPPDTIRCTRIESKRVDLLSEAMWSHGKVYQNDIETCRNQTISRLVPQQNEEELPPKAKTRKRKRQSSFPRAWRRWRKAPPKSSRLVSQRELVQISTAAAKHLIPKCTVPTIVYIESQPAGRSSNAKIGAVGTALYSSIRQRMMCGDEALIACEFIPAARKYSAIEVYEANGLCKNEQGAVTRRGKPAYQHRKSESCRIARAIRSNVEMEGTETLSPETKTVKGDKLDDKADAIILAYLASRDVHTAIRLCKNGNIRL